MKKQFNLTCYKTTGFYFFVVSVVMLIAAMILYKTQFVGTLADYHNPMVYVPGIVGIVASLALLAFKPTARYAGLVLWACSLVTFLMFVLAIYMYFTGVFYSGISSEAFKLIDKGVLSSTILFLLSLILGNVAMWLKQVKE